MEAPSFPISRSNGLTGSPVLGVWLCVCFLLFSPELGCRSALFGQYPRAIAYRIPHFPRKKQSAGSAGISPLLRAFGLAEAPPDGGALRSFVSIGSSHRGFQRGNRFLRCGLRRAWRSGIRNNVRNRGWRARALNDFAADEKALFPAIRRDHAEGDQPVRRGHFDRAAKRGRRAKVLDHRHKVRIAGKRERNFAANALHARAGEHGKRPLPPVRQVELELRVPLVVVRVFIFSDVA